MLERYTFDKDGINFHWTLKEIPRQWRFIDLGIWLFFGMFND